MDISVASSVSGDDKDQVRSVRCYFHTCRRLSRCVLHLSLPLLFTSLTAIVFSSFLYFASTFFPAFLIWLATLNTFCLSYSMCIIYTSFTLYVLFVFSHLQHLWASSTFPLLGSGSDSLSLNLCSLPLSPLAHQLPLSFLYTLFNSYLDHRLLKSFLFYLLFPPLSLPLFPTQLMVVSVWWGASGWVVREQTWCFMDQGYSFNVKGWNFKPLPSGRKLPTWPSVNPYIHDWSKGALGGSMGQASHVPWQSLQTKNVVA